jgi:acetylornithine/succinyldiaminopimelate/putrescine aminotransferase
VITTADIADRVVGDGLWNLSSHQSDPLAAAAVAAVIDIVRDEGLVERAAENGAYFIQRLTELAARQPAISGVRGVGLMIGFDFLADDAERPADAASSFMLLCRERGLHLTYCFGDVTFRIIPPLVITRAEIDRAIEIIESAGRDVASNPGIGKSAWPENPCTRRLFNNSSWRRIVDYCWRSSPEKLVAKGKEIVRQRTRQESAGANSTSRG